MHRVQRGVILFIIFRFCPLALFTSRSLVLDAFRCNLHQSHDAPQPTCVVGGVSGSSSLKTLNRLLSQYIEQFQV